MLDVEFLAAETKSVKQTILHQYTSTIFKPAIERKLFDLFKQKSWELVTLDMDAPISHLNQPTLFGERIFYVDLSKHAKAKRPELATIFQLIQDKQMTQRILFSSSPESAQVFDGNPAWIALSKVSTFIEEVKPTKGSLKKILECYRKDAQVEAPSNSEAYESSLLKLLNNDDFPLEVFYKTLDMVQMLCVSDSGVFDPLLFTRHIYKEEERMNFFRMHEIVFAILATPKEQAGYAMNQLTIELDTLVNVQGLDSRQVLGRLSSALRDILLVSSRVGGATDHSEHITKFKRSKLLSYAEADPLSVIRLQSLLVTNEPKLRNSSNLIVDLQTHFLERFYS